MKSTSRIATVAALAALAYAATFGCSKDEGNGGGSAGHDGTGATFGSAGGGADCTALGTGCIEDNECCTGHCDPTANVCAREPGACLEAGASCATGSECCTFACVDRRCSESQCTADGDTCTVDDECCGGSCDGGACTPLSMECRTSGNVCSDHGDCCSSYCDDGICGAPSYCTQAGDLCTTDAECCAGLCQKDGAAEYGLCAVAPASGAGGCLPAGEVCSGGAVYDGGNLPVCGGEWCSRACFPYGPIGVLICQPPSGCHPTGEICREDGDCCGSAGLPDGERSDVHCSKVDGNEIGRCDAGNACTPAGGICRLQTVECSANANCCAGNVLQYNTCKQDSLGIPRCLAAEVDCTDAENYVGVACASAADCCGLPCLPNPGGDPAFVCGETCVADGGACTTTADCCAGIPCVIPPGSTAGVCGARPPTGEGGAPPTPPTCAEYGQDCTDSGDCCNEVPCTDGKCVAVIY